MKDMGANGVKTIMSKTAGLANWIITLTVSPGGGGGGQC